jgi:two-component system response regulator RegA
MNERVLIVDDDAAFCHTLRRALARRNLEVAIAGDCEQALECSRRSSFDKIILDLKIGAASGLQILPELKRNQPDAGILVLTGYSSIPTAVEAIKRGAINYLCKPADVEGILAAFENTYNAPTEPAAERPSVKRLEWEHIQTVLNENNGNISATARELKMHRRTLQRKLQKRPTKQ